MQTTKKKCLEMFKNCDRMFLITHFYAVALSHVTWLTFQHLQSIFWRIANYLYRSNVALYCLVNFCYVPILDHVTLQFAKLCWNIYCNPFKVRFTKMENCMWCFNYFTVLRQFLFLKGKLSPPPSALPLPAPKNFYLNGCEWWKNCNFWWWYCPYYSLRFALIKRQCSLASEFRSVSSAKNMKIYQNNLSKQCS